MEQKVNLVDFTRQGHWMMRQHLPFIASGGNLLSTLIRSYFGWSRVCIARLLCSRYDLTSSKSMVAVTTSTSFKENWLP